MIEGGEPLLGGFRVPLNLLLVILKNAFALFLEPADVEVRAYRHCACSRREITEWGRR